MSIRNYGFVPPSIITPDEYTLGSKQVPEVVTNPSGDWRDALPTYEPQYNKETDTHGCTVWGGTNQLEIFIKKLTGTEHNFSERFSYILAKIRPPGANPHQVYEVFRKTGFIEDALFPFQEGMSFDEFVQPDPPAQEHIDLGEKWLTQNTYLHEWITPSIEKLKYGLTLSPIAVSVTAWTEREGLFVDEGQPNTHWCVLVGIEYINGKYYRHIFDSYNHAQKILAPDHNIQFAKRIYWEKKKQEAPLKKQNWFIRWLLKPYLCRQ